MEFSTDSLRYKLLRNNAIEHQVGVVVGSRVEEGMKKSRVRFLAIDLLLNFARMGFLTHKVLE